MRITNLRYLAQIINSKCIGRPGTHIQAFNTKINGVRTCLYSGSQRLTRADRSHYFKVFYRRFHYSFDYVCAKVGFFPYFCSQITVRI